MNARCKEFDNGTALHIASSNLGIEAVKCLVGHTYHYNNIISNWENSCHCVCVFKEAARLYHKAANHMQILNFDLIKQKYQL